MLKAAIDMPKPQPKADIPEADMAIEQINAFIMNNFANMYEIQNKLELAEKYYLMAIEHNNSIAMSNLGNLYLKQNQKTN